MHKVKTDGYENLGAFLARLSGIACTMPLARVLQLTGGVLPTAATSAAWWSEPEGWEASAGSGVCRSAGWRVEKVHMPTGLIRFSRTVEESGII